MFFLEPGEWKSLKDKIVKAAPSLLLILTVLVIGYSSGWHMKGSDVVMDCKYANSFRFNTEAFTCQRKI